MTTQIESTSLWLDSEPPGWRTSFGVNACFVRHGRVGGAEQATVNLLEGLATQVGPGETWTVYGREPLVVRHNLHPLRQRTLPDLRRVNRMAYEPVALAMVRQPDVWLNLNYATPWTQRTPSVTVVHDSQHAHFPENFSDVKRTWLNRAHAATARRSNAIVAISQFTADDFMRLHGAPVAGKLHVIPNAVSFDRLEPDGETIVPTRPYLLSVAAHYRHKNLETLLRAYKTIRRHHDIDLVLVGQHKEALVGRASALDLGEYATQEGVRFTGFVSDAQLGALYRSAAAFVFPSLFEGFGLPVVESLGLRVPTVTTRCAAIPEVGGDLPSYVDDPRSPDDFAKAISSVLDDPDSARPDAAGAAALRERFSPTTIAAQYAELMRNVT